MKSQALNTSNVKNSLSHMTIIIDITATLIGLQLHCCSHIMLRHPESPEWRVKPTTLGITAIEHPHSTRKTLPLLLRTQRYMWQITMPHYFPLSQAQIDLQRGFKPPTRWEPFVAVTMLHRPEPPEWRVEPTTLSVTAIEYPHSTWKTLIAVTNSTLYVANHHATISIVGYLATAKA